MKKIISFLSLSAISSSVFAGGSLPFVSALDELSGSMQAGMVAIAIIAIIAFSILASTSEGGGFGKLAMITIFISVGASAAAVAGILFIGAGAGALI